MLPVSPNLFRVLVVLATILPLIGPLLNGWFLPELPVAHAGQAARISSGMFAFLASFALVLGLASSIGLCFFQRWSRTASLVSVAVAVVVYAASSYFVDAGPKFASDWLGTLLGGAVLALAYCSPIALRFAPAPVASPVP